MNQTLRITYSAFILVAASLTGLAQPTSHPLQVAQERRLFHDYVDKEQKRLLALDGKADDSISLSKDAAVNQQVADAVTRRVDEIQQHIEADTSLSSQGKIKYLRSLESMLRGYSNNYGKPDFPVTIIPGLVTAFEKSMSLDRKNQSIEPVIIENNYGIGTVLVDCFLFPTENAGVKPGKLELIKKYCLLHPDQLWNVVQFNPDIPFSDSLIVVAGHRDIRKLYDYAAASNWLGSRIRSSQDSLVRVVAQLANSRSGQIYFPFLDELIHGRLDIDEINRIKDNDLAYYRLLVKTQISYVERAAPPLRDTALEMGALADRLAKKAREVFVQEINALHTVEIPALRFKILDPLSAEELYYLVVMSEDVIYTSSYLGVYDRIFQRMATPRGDSLLLRVHGDRFRKFIKMAAAYNKLDHFLGSMEKEHANEVMFYFASKLETEGEEQAVDVADSYSSIFEKNPALAAFVLDAVQWNYDKNLKAANKRGIVIYNLLQTLFESADTTRKIDLSAKLGIPPVYTVDYASLADKQGRVVQQVFFYGDQDKDGQNSYTNFLALFQNKTQWKIVEDAAHEWITITSLKGKPVTIYANKPLYGEDDPDAKAQEHLTDYLDEHDIKPTIYIHRGHSYHVKYTLEKIKPSARIVILGSCGGYNNLSEVLKISDDAHIISSKQVGTKAVNEPILEAINNTLLSGRNVDWLSMWKNLTFKFRNNAAAREKFDDYIPPYKNLGAIFIKAYRRAMQ